jgi:ribonucleotide monophosphatase NagD (HAD superfamily)
LKVAPNEALVVGDRLETDIAGGQSAGCLTALVLSGVSTPEMANEWSPSPDLILPDLTSLLDELESA